MNNVRKFGTCVTLLATQALLPAVAELNDPPYFNLWTNGIIYGDSLVGDGDVAQLCGTSACSGGIDPDSYATFSVVHLPSGTGSGHIDPFLRFAHNEPPGTGGSNPTEAAYNTGPSGNPSGTGVIGTITDNPTASNTNQAKDAAGTQFNHVIKLSDLMAQGGMYTFLLDINEPGSTKSTLRIDELALFLSTETNLNMYTRDTDGLNAANLAKGMFTDAGANVAKIWDMDFNATSAGGTSTIAGNSPGTEVTGNGSAGSKLGGLNINNVNDSGKAGSGDYDMQMQLSTKLFDTALAALGGGVSADDAYVYLYNWMGEADKNCDPDGDCSTEAEANFEEWAAVLKPSDTPGGGPGIPEPGTAFLLTAGLVGMLRSRHQRIARN